MKSRGEQHTRAVETNPTYFVMLGAAEFRAVRKVRITRQ